MIKLKLTNFDLTRHVLWLLPEREVITKLRDAADALEKELVTNMQSPVKCPHCGGLFDQENGNSLILCDGCFV